MTKKIKKGYDWIEDQQDNWDYIVAEKLEQLDALSQSHLDWFNKHTTIGEILSWKRPVFDAKKDDATKQQAISSPQKVIIDIPQLEESVGQISTDRNSKDTLEVENEKLTSRNNIEVHCSTPDFENSQQLESHVKGLKPQQNNKKENLDYIVFDADIKPDDLVKGADMLESLEAPKKSESKMQVDAAESVTIPDTAYQQSNISKRISSNSAASDGNLTVHTPDLVTDLDSQQTQTQKAPKTPEAYAPIEIEDISDNFKLDSMQHVTQDKRTENSIITFENEKEDEFLNEEEDEIQLVVSNRSIRKDESVEETLEKSSIQPPLLQSVISPPQNIAPAIIASPVRHQSTFMSRLFQVGSAKERSLKEDSPSPFDFVTTRPKSTTSASTINNEASNKFSMSLLQNRVEKRSPEPISAEIEVSDSMPYSPFKKPKTLSKKKATAETAKNIPKSQIKEDEKQKKVEESEEDDKIYEIPSWAQGEELYSHLLNQAGLDPDAIFGRMTPLHLEEIFAKEFTTKIPEQAP